MDSIKFLLIDRLFSLAIKVLSGVRMSTSCPFRINLDFKYARRIVNRIIFALLGQCLKKKKKKQQRNNSEKCKHLFKIPGKRLTSELFKYFYSSTYLSANIIK